MSSLKLAYRAVVKDAVGGLLPVLRRIRSVSFSQYGEDLLLPHLRPRRRGFYVDVGAFDPRMHSNTYRLYLKGWDGITIEPNPDAAAPFKAARPRDTHLTIGIADSTSDLTYYKCRNPAENTFDCDRAKQIGDDLIAQVCIPCMTLNDVFSTYCAGRQVDLLDIDCEARDLQVLQSLDFTRFRPTAVIVEDFEQFESGGAATPGSGAIRSFLVSNGYAMAAQSFFSFLFVDKQAFARAARDEGFALDQSQFGLLAQG